MMRQIIQDLGQGRLRLVEAPDPIARPGHVLIANVRSVISAGTEKMMMELARKSLLGKARERPDAVRRVLEKLGQEGFFATLQQVRERLAEPMTMGYSSAGVVLAVGAGVQEFKPGDRVASNGPHAGVVCVPKHLCALVPPAVSFEQAAFTVLAAIALQGVRLSRLALGETAFVIGLGLIGQITVALLHAAGVCVLGTDPDAAKCCLALQMGAAAASPDMEAGAVKNFTRGLGADAVLITASTPSDQPLALAGAAVRKKGRVVVVGAVGLNLDRRTFYFKEAEVVVSCSYGPGRYEYDYEEAGHDYPPAYVRWTEQRNMSAVLDLMAAGKLDLSPLISHRFSMEDALSAYELIESGREPYLGIILEYPEVETRPQRTIILRCRPGDEKIPIGCIGAGSFARLTLLPLMRRQSLFRLRLLCSAGGLSAAVSGEKLGFEAVTTDEEEVFSDPEIKAVFILTRHHQHAGQVVKALQAGKHVFVEKPLALTLEELAQIEAVLAEAGETSPLLLVGFNRRFSPAATQVKEWFKDMNVPLTVSLRMNAGEIPPDHWTQDELVGGGRIIGEACHALDLAVFLCGSPAVRVFAEAVSGPQAPAITEDQSFITLRHENGSISSTAYLAGGDRALPKERVEVVGGGRMAVIDDFHGLTLAAGGKVRRVRLARQDKGHGKEIEVFAQTLAQGGPAPISWNELRTVSAAAILAGRSIREGIPFEIP